jgi:hypothetical protein
MIPAMRSLAVTGLVALVLTGSALAGTGVRAEINTYVKQARTMARHLILCTSRPQNDHDACAYEAERTGPALGPAIGNPGMIRIAYGLTQKGTRGCRTRAHTLWASAVAADNAISDSQNGIIQTPYGAPASVFRRAARLLRVSATDAVRYRRACLR